jgi:hypothetical protein
LSQLKTILIHRLKSKGVEPRLIPGFIRSLANSVLASPQRDLWRVRKTLHYLGWQEIDLDYHTMQLAIEYLETEGLIRLESRPAIWFSSRFKTETRPA